MSRDLSQYVNTEDAAKMLGVKKRNVQRLIKERRVKWIQPGGHDFLVFIPSIEKYLETKSKRGRPPSGSPESIEAA